ncbi:peroxiredoxin family protein [Halohasta litchfieldiae]|jgi:peroxiredoxin family protein|uniref:Peroxiredoxin family protein n=1 Tax=Halohasta litchfieldiae TaxID=1073996 RepID=A0A1H6WZU9_9EURY|nr:DsrE/DsrF/DrsH-like family protein [Halohasta litchfieldiae]ATW89560.1 peroxiredoxin family protein [Halohasta litchfieldiae]SEJ22423.1 Peroxiredoxin family protein [Halohasta litchfieldiae]
MSTDATAGSDADPSTDDLAELQAQVEALETELADLRSDVETGPKKMVIIATKGTLDMAYPPLILASTAAAFGYDVTVFHTFWGLEILHEKNSKNLQLSSVGNPNMPVPNAIAALPGMDRVTTRMMRNKIADNEVASVEELIDVSLESGVDLQACQMTIDLLGYDEEDFYDGVTTGVGAASAFQEMVEADIQLLV